MKQLIFASVCMLTFGTYSQEWHANGTLNNGNIGNKLGTFTPHSINIFTNGIHRAQFTTGNTLSSWAGNVGDGLRILPPAGNYGNLDLFTSGGAGGNETHAVFGGSGQVSGQNNRFEFISTGASLGNYYSTFSGNGIHRFDRGTTVYGRLGTNNFWRFGENTSGTYGGGVNATRRVEVVDNNIQFRLTYSPNAGGPFTDFLSNNNGNLQIMPSGKRVGINLHSDPTATIDVNGDARIRNVQAETPNSILVGVNATGASDVKVRRLDFNNNPNTFLAGDGTFQTVNSTPPPANNGVSRVAALGNAITPYQLGDAYTPISITNTPLTSNRQVRLNNNSFIFSGAGKVGIGLSYPNLPTEKLDVNGNARLRKLPDSLYMADSLTNKVVMVDETGVLRWLDKDSLSSIQKARNGLSVDTLGYTVFGQDFQEANDPAKLLSTREIPMSGHSILYTDNGRMGIGNAFSNPATTPLAKLDIRPSIVDEKGLYVAADTNFSSIPFYEMNTVSNYTQGTVETTGFGIYMGGNSIKRSTGLRIENETKTGSAFGIEATVKSDSTTSNTAARFGAHGVNGGNVGVSAGASGSHQGNTAGSFRAGNVAPNGTNGITNVGVAATNIAGQNSIGLMAWATGGTVNNYAAHLTGDVYANGTIVLLLTKI